MSTFEVVSLNVSDAKGTLKRPVGQVQIDGHGIVGDAHAGAWHRQVSLLDQEQIGVFAREMGRPIAPGEFAENVTTAGLDTRRVALLDRLRLGAVELEVTQIGKECHGQGCTVFQQVGKCVMPKEGIFARVVRGGAVAAGDAGEHLPRTLRVLIVTLSDRAAAGQYADRSGPRLRELVEARLAGTRWHAQLDAALLPDDADRLRARLISARDDGVDLLLTTGGTGVGPRDITPETAAGVCDKLLPGIMEHIRTRYGAAKPAALLSRSIAGVSGRTQIYTLPGSVRAVEEYWQEIAQVWEHVLLMLHGVDVH